MIKLVIEMEKKELLKQYIEQSNHIVFFGGAGVSTASGIKDFRGKDGLYKEKYKVPVEVLLSHSYFKQHPLEFYSFYKDKMYCFDKEPNVIHHFLKKLEDCGKLKAIVTQNIDGLHERSGCKNVYLLHGSTYQNYCENCKKSYPSDAIFKAKGIPKCSCGGLIRPNVVLYEEPLDEEVVSGAIKNIEEADLLIVAGTSLVVYPAASFIGYLRNGKLVILNEEETPYDKRADIVLHEDLKDIFTYLEKNTKL